MAMDTAMTAAMCSRVIMVAAMLVPFVLGVRMEGGFKMEISPLNSKCHHGLISSGDGVKDRISCAVKKSFKRLDHIGLRLGLDLNRAGADAMPSRIAKLYGDDDYESPVSTGGGDYVTTMSLGTPLKTYPVIVDTGSDLVWLQCKPCDICFKQTDPIFDPQASSTYSTRQCSDSMCKALQNKACNPDCTYAYAYGDGSGSRGTLSSESITLSTIDGAKKKVTNFAFGCGHRNKGSFGDAAGLMGLGRGPLSLVSQLGSLFGNQFSYCLVPWLDAPSVTSPLYLGSGPQDGLEFSYTPLITNPRLETFYYVQLLDISVAGRRLNIPKGTFDIQSDGTGGMIFDSGTTLTLIDDAAYSRVLKAFSSRISLPKVDGSSIGLDLCYDVSKAKCRKTPFPSLTFHFQDADYDLPLDNYFVAANDAGTILCLAMSSTNVGINIFGNIQQQNFRIVYDLDNDQLGFAATKC